MLNILNLFAQRGQVIRHDGLWAGSLHELATQSPSQVFIINCWAGVWSGFPIQNYLTIQTTLSNLFKLFRKISGWQYLLIPWTLIIIHPILTIRRSLLTNWCALGCRWFGWWRRLGFLVSTRFKKVLLWFGSRLGLPILPHDIEQLLHNWVLRFTMVDLKKGLRKPKIDRQVRKRVWLRRFEDKDIKSFEDKNILNIIKHKRLYKFKVRVFAFALFISVIHQRDKTP